MSHMLLVVDETASGEHLNEVEISVNVESLTVKEIITLRVENEVRAYNSKSKERVFNGLIQPADSEVRLNKYHLRKNQEIDVEKQVYVALDAFLKNGYFVFIDDLQVEDLDEEVMMHPQLKVSFVKLTPLVGG